MSGFEALAITAADRARCEDRAIVLSRGERTVIVVADGAGGMGHGDEAADTVVRELRTAAMRAEPAEQWQAELGEIDARIRAGESTAVVVDLHLDRICGASVGDSQAWHLHDGELVDLTQRQHRKPLLGSGCARPVGFAAPPLGSGVLLVATDGFCSYVDRGELLALVSSGEFADLPRHCVELVRLPSGALWDDIGLVVCRRQPAPATS